MFSYTSVKRSDVVKLVFPSVLGIFLFMIPIYYQGEVTISVAILSRIVQDGLAEWLPAIITCVIVSSASLTVITKITKGNWMWKSGFLHNLFYVSWFWVIVRSLGAVFCVCTFFHIGFEGIGSENTGGLLLTSLLPILVSVFLFAGMLLPLLLNFGLLELCGVLLTKFMRPIFLLPGRSSIDCLTSWLGDGTIGVLLTSKQYEDGYYTQREAAVIGTTFSVVSITFSLVIISQVNLSHMFVPFYLTVLFVGVVTAIICPRIPPLSRKPDTYYRVDQKEVCEQIPSGYTPLQWGIIQGIERAKENRLRDFFKEGLQNVLDMWLGVIPTVMAFGTIALLLAEFTPVFKVLGMPFIPLLEILQVPEAREASQSMIVGFADMFLPAVLASDIQSDMTRFIIACVSVTQLIYMSEVGSLILGSKIPVSLKELFVIFLERALISLPFIVLIAHILF